LQLEARRPDRFEDFVSGPNESALAAVRHLLDEPGANLYLSGPDGSGKSHLLNALCHAAREREMAAFYIALKSLPEEAADSLQGLRVLDLVCVDDLDCVAGNPVWKTRCSVVSMKSGQRRAGFWSAAGIHLPQ
jgi:DnaA family protein